VALREIAEQGRSSGGIAGPQMGECQRKQNILVPAGNPVRAPKPAQGIGPIAGRGKILASPPRQPCQRLCPAHIALGRRPPKKARPDIQPIPNHAISHCAGQGIVLLLSYEKKKTLLFLKKKKQKT
jgi:hypothetical protein